MSGILWHVFSFGAIFIFLILAVYRVLAIIRQPVHLRWELSPIPHEKGKGIYGGSYLEEFEWWRKPRKRSLVAPIVYMLREIFLMKGVWKNRRSLWPFSYSLHAGIYLIVITIFLHIFDAVFIITDVPVSVQDVFHHIASITAIAGYILGTVGSIGLILQRRLDDNYRPFTTWSMYFQLVFLGAVFVSGIGAWWTTTAYASEMSQFVKSLITLDSSITVTQASAAHIIMTLMFIIYLPLTDMLHFITKYFTYHAVRWNDAPMDEKLNKKMLGLVTRPIGWSAPHAGSGKSWAEIVTKKKDNAEET
jgi:nitrate reductase gamma subunit